MTMIMIMLGFLLGMGVAIAFFTYLNNQSAARSKADNLTGNPIYAEMVRKLGYDPLDN